MKNQKEAPKINLNFSFMEKKEAPKNEKKIKKIIKKKSQKTLEIDIKEDIKIQEKLI